MITSFDQVFTGEQINLDEGWAWYLGLVGGRPWIVAPDGQVYRESSDLFWLVGSVDPPVMSAELLGGRVPDAEYHRWALDVIRKVCGDCPYCMEPVDLVMDDDGRPTQTTCTHCDWTEPID